jgi:aspartyl-tRNA(Asn)/glutamyl-tRNA(Gln) amidotransferase subunit B
LVDYNRAGVPLLEIVSEPDIRSAEQAKRYVEELRATLLAIGVSDVKMEEGSLRVDANVSLRPDGSSELGTRTEIKNLNSLRSLVRAVEYEVKRQSGLLESGERVVQETRHWDEDGGRTISGRSKEEAHDYRYFPEPDLVPVAPTDEMRTQVRESMPELPTARRLRLIEQWGIKEEDARVLVDVPGLADYAERAVAALQSGTPKDVANWVRQDVLGYLNERGLSPAVLAPEMLAELVGLVADRTISRGQAKDVLTESMAEEKWPRDIVRERNIVQLSNTVDISATVSVVVTRAAETVDQYHAATDDNDRKKKRNALMGAVMRELGGKADPRVVNEELDKQLGG